jgi:hypothetical protein
VDGQVARGTNCNCLTKQYISDGSVLFRDLCTKEAAIATLTDPKAQANASAAQWPDARHAIEDSEPRLCRGSVSDDNQMQHKTENTEEPTMLVNQTWLQMKLSSPAARKTIQVLLIADSFFMLGRYSIEFSGRV